MSLEKEKYKETQHDVKNTVDDGDGYGDAYGDSGSSGKGKGKNFKNSTTPVLDNFSRDLSALDRDWEKRSSDRNGVR